jgi:cytochrome c oxidase assembly protein subunit 15
VLIRREAALSPDGVARLRRQTSVLVVVMLIQGAIGYLQYATGVPAWLVLLHVAGSVAFWVAVLFVRFAARDRGPAPAEITTSVRALP